MGLTKPRRVAIPKKGSRWLGVRSNPGEKKRDFCRIKCTNLAIPLNTVGMEDKERDLQNLSQSELNLIQRLRKQPKMMERVQRILDISSSSEGPLKTADEIEELLLEEMRRLGNDTMTEWATQAEERVGQEVQKQDPTVLKRKKKR